MSARLAACLLMAFAAAGAHTQAYLKLGTPVRGEIIAVTWPDGPVRYVVSNGAAGAVGPADLQAAAARAFDAWEAVDSASIHYEFSGFTTARPDQEDGLTTLGFLPRPDLDRVLASTNLTIDTLTGKLVEVDIFFNSTFTWSTAAGGASGRFDLESIALHEIGHLSGLGHSALGETELAGGGQSVRAAEAVMFPVAFAPGSTAGRTLRPDDIAGISDLYPNGSSPETGSISGRVTKNNVGVFGAHVVAFHMQSGALIGGFALDGLGRFVIAALPPGPYLLRAEPLDDADPDSFFVDDAAVDVDFRPAFFSRIVVVPAGGDSGSVTIRVVRK